jgi:hypothetical protein
MENDKRITIAYLLQESAQKRLETIADYKGRIRELESALCELDQSYCDLARRLDALTKTETEGNDDEGEKFNDR